MENSKKKAAAIAAVMGYLRNEEDMIRMQAMSAQPMPEAPAQIKLWGLSARQAMMQTRNLMQLRTFHGSRLR